MVALSSLLCLAVAPTAFASQPVVVYLPPIIYDDPWVCGGDPVIHVIYDTDTKLTMTFDQDGNLIRDTLTGGGKIFVTFSSDVSDRTLSGPSPAPFRTAYNADGSISTLQATGLNVAITIPGQGVVLLDAGVLTWDGGFGGSVDGSGGHHNWYLGGDTEAFCDYLSA
jgi:hypothetical protein